MKETIKYYINGEVTVAWKPSLCIHSTNCFRGLIQVFNPARRPWINMQGASTERIIQQVQQCPSGALSYIMNEKSAGEQKRTESSPK